MSYTSARSMEPMLHWLPNQGTVFNLLPPLSSPHGYIFLTTGKWRGNDLFFLPVVLCSTPSLPRHRVSIRTQFIFHIIPRPIPPVSNKPLFTLRERIPAWPFGFKLIPSRVAIEGQDHRTCSGHHTSSDGGESHSRQPCANCQHPFFSFFFPALPGKCETWSVNYWNFE